MFQDKIHVNKILEKVHPSTQKVQQFKLFV